VPQGRTSSPGLTHELQAGQHQQSPPVLQPPVPQREEFEHPSWPRQHPRPGETPGAADMLPSPGQGERRGGDASKAAPRQGRCRAVSAPRRRCAGLLRAEKQRGEGMTDLKLTCQTPHQYYDNSSHRLSDPARRLTARAWLCGGRAGCRAGSARGERAPVPPHSTPASLVLSTTSDPTQPFPRL